MSPVSAFFFHSALLVVPGLIAALGGIASFWLRDSKVLGRIVPLATAAILFGLGGACRCANFPLALWLAPTLCGLVISLQLAVSFPFVVTLASRVMSKTRLLTAPRHWGVVLMGIGPVLLAGSLWQLDVMVTPETASFEGITDYPEADLVEATGVSAFTDHGRRIPIYKVRAETADTFAITGERGLPIENTPLPYRAIRLTEANSVSNCTGWVFTGAHSWIQCRDVEQILDDNGYEAVKVARPGDLVIYREAEGAIVHVGCVMALLNEGRPLIESKWGYQGVFLHLPEGTPFGDAWTFYHTKRPDHLLRMSSGETSGRAVSEAAP
jgi:hypothetical protein